MITQIVIRAAALVAAVLALVGIGAVFLYVYGLGLEDGYWEHEAEENIYRCEVI